MNSKELEINLQGEEDVLVLFEDQDGLVHAIQNIRFDRNGLQDTDSEVPVVVLEDGGVVEVE